jgi:hypothetical protein
VGLGRGSRAVLGGKILAPSTRPGPTLLAPGTMRASARRRTLGRAFGWTKPSNVPQLMALRREEGRQSSESAVAVAPALGDFSSGSTGPLPSKSASSVSISSGSFDGSIFRTSSSISLPGLNVTTFFDGT